ncbi:hypothetical protein KP509_10G061700 [Ceratopteris richardii]|uniref:Uncharacterized protein n=1 Tax=Ceratopteris richardii TaxID=49495 RepID=A0A8T2TZK2_CERRI|nr:hypothetical protein KP509_10G061700 [Ceratopteris richardii]
MCRREFGLFFSALNHLEKDCYFLFLSHLDGGCSIYCIHVREREHFLYVRRNLERDVLFISRPKLLLPLVAFPSYSQAIFFCRAVEVIVYRAQSYPASCHIQRLRNLSLCVLAETLKITIN